MPRRVTITVYSIDELTGEAKARARGNVVTEIVRRKDWPEGQRLSQLLDDYEFLADWAVSNGLDFLPDGRIYREET